MTSTVKERKDITDKQKDKIMRANAIRLYGWAN
jgi:predicted TIM-barrel fold metal-dependent hydrolase